MQLNGNLTETKKNLVKVNEKISGVDFNQIAITKASDTEPYVLHFYNNYNWIVSLSLK